MNILCVISEYWRNGKTCAALRPAIEAMQEEQVKAEFFYLGSEPIADCTGCGECGRIGWCRLEDRASEFAEQAKRADGFLFCSPRYLETPDIRMIHLLHRAFSSSESDLRNKPIAWLMGGGMTPYLPEILERFHNCAMPVVCVRDWTSIGSDARFPSVDSFMRTLGSDMAALSRETGWTNPPRSCRM